MKTETVKRIKQKALNVMVEPRLDEFFDGKVLFPEKLAHATEFLKKHPLPESVKERKA